MDINVTNVEFIKCLTENYLDKNIKPKNMDEQTWEIILEEHKNGNNKTARLAFQKNDDWVKDLIAEVAKNLF